MMPFRYRLVPWLSGNMLRWANQLAPWPFRTSSKVGTGIGPTS